jgi:hypothetical protein
MDNQSSIEEKKPLHWGVPTAIIGLIAISIILAAKLFDSPARVSPINSNGYELTLCQQGANCTKIQNVTLACNEPIVTTSSKQVDCGILFKITSN